MRVRCTRNRMDPMANTTLTRILGKRRCIIPHVLQSFQDFADVVAAFKTHGSIKVIMNPAGGNIVARGKSECPKCSGMVRTFITQISTGIVHVLHGEPKRVLGASGHEVRGKTMPQPWRSFQLCCWSVLVTLRLVYCLWSIETFNIFFFEKNIINTKTNNWNSRCEISDLQYSPSCNILETRFFTVANCVFL